MKLSLWQQFSSNHSASFIIIGQFESTEWAQEVLAEIHSIIQAIGWWNENLLDKPDTLQTMSEWLLDPTEAAKIPKVFAEPEFMHALLKEGYLSAASYYQKRFQVEGDRLTLYWIENPSAVQFAQSYQEFLIMELPRGGSVAEPFRTIMMQLNGDVFAVDTEDYPLFLNVTCIAPDSQAAETIVESMKIYSDEGVWKGIHIPNLADSKIDAETILEAQGIAIVLKNFYIYRYLKWGTQHHSIVEILKAIDSFFQHQGCIDIEFRFASQVK